MRSKGQKMSTKPGPCAAASTRPRQKVTARSYSCRMLIHLPSSVSVTSARTTTPNENQLAKSMTTNIGHARANPSARRGHCPRWHRRGSDRAWGHCQHCQHVGSPARLPLGNEEKLASLIQQGSNAASLKESRRTGSSLRP